MSAAAIAQRRLEKSRSRVQSSPSRSSYPIRVQAANRAAAAYAAAQQAAYAASAAALAPASSQSPPKSQDRSSSDHIGRDVPPPERHGGGLARRVSRLGDALAARALKGAADADDVEVSKAGSTISIDATIDTSTPRTRARSAAVHQLKERVAEARFVGITEVERRVRELAQPAMEQYFADQINEVDLKQHKSEAREKATAEVLDAECPHATLDLAFGEFAEAIGTREVARLLLTRAEEAEAAAEARLVVTLEAVEKGAAAEGGRAGAEATGTSVSASASFSCYIYYVQIGRAS